MQLRGRKLISIGVPCVVLIIVAATLLNLSAINRQLHSWRVLPEPERLTELYYQDHTKLPVSYTPGVPQTFSFTVHNLEYRDTTYDYTVVQKSEDGSENQTLTSGSFQLSQDKSKTTPVTIIPADFIGRSQITTTLKGGRESIHYWVNKIEAVQPETTEGA